MSNVVTSGFLDSSVVPSVICAWAAEAVTPGAYSPAANPANTWRLEGAALTWEAAAETWDSEARTWDQLNG